jgi:hypothetical protein
MSHKFTVRWTDANGAGWIRKTPLGRDAVVQCLKKILTQKRVKKTHATIVTITLNQ